MKTTLQNVIPVLPSQDIERDVEWYNKFAGFKSIWHDNMYAVIKRDNTTLHLQWHADTEEDPLLGGSVIRIVVKDIKPIFEEFVERKTVNTDKLTLKTAWDTNEFGFYDLNKNGVFIVEWL